MKGVKGERTLALYCFCVLCRTFPDFRAQLMRGKTSVSIIGMVKKLLQVSFNKPRAQRETFN